MDRSRRTSGLQLPSSFARALTSDEAPPPSRMIQGGRGGAVRLRLYLSTVLLGRSVNSHALYGANAVYNVSAASWARCLALPDPDTRGARRVADAQGWLHEHRFLDVTRRPGSEPVVRLLSPDGATARGPGRPRRISPSLSPSGRSTGSGLSVRASSPCSSRSWTSKAAGAAHRAPRLTMDDYRATKPLRLLR